MRMTNDLSFEFTLDMSFFFMQFCSEKCLPTGRYQLWGCKNVKCSFHGVYLKV